MCVCLSVCLSRVAAQEDREYQIDRLEFVKNQLNLLIDDTKKRIKAISEEVASKVRLCGRVLVPGCGRG
jgi:hypothetical protein